MTTVTYNIPGINCGHCEHTIKMEVGDLEGVQSV
ncbi:MAG: heavy-metal-associated domain-containing protein, partial [Chloroflexi bacterium]|nr:heavy-metal-associated domain-containing protein [Chloroflexota bacterium]